MNYKREVISFTLGLLSVFFITPPILTLKYEIFDSIFIFILFTFTATILGILSLVLGFGTLLSQKNDKNFAKFLLSIGSILLGLIPIIGLWLILQFALTLRSIFS